MSNILVCGSVSYDTITLFKDRFSNHIVPGQEEFPDLAFHVSDLRNEFGGCAVNICYNLKMLNCEASPVATVGDDFHDYQERLESYGIPIDYIKHIENTKTAHYFITVDENENQIVVFHPGAMDFSHENKIEHPEGVQLGVISPDATKGMRLHAKQFIEKKIPFIFDPGPITRLLNGEELKYFVQHASWVIINNHEWNLLKDKIGMEQEELVNTVEALVITNGSSGSEIITRDETFSIPPGEVSSLVDPTGCGDAYRAGIIFSIMNKLDWRTGGEIAALMGAICAEHSGAQNHQITMDELLRRYERNYSKKLQFPR